MNFEKSSEFAKELKKFSKKWRSLPDDLESLQKVLLALYLGGDGLAAKQIREGFFANKKAAVLQSISSEIEVVKVRLDCKDLNQNLLRVAYIRSGSKILLVELFSKADKEREDQVRIKNYLRNM